MKSAIRTTLLMALMALASVAAAAYYFPWQVAVDSAEMEGKNLFEDYETDKVSWIELTRFDRDSNEVKSIRLRKRNDKWIVPAKNNFEANNGTRISETVVCLNQRMVSEVKENTQEFHIEYGVVDPDNEISATSRAGIGAKITLEDRSKQTIADLIIGKRVTGTEKIQHYVRIPGQTTVYVVEFDENIINTNFGAWVNPNLVQLALRPNAPGQRLDSIEIESYRLDADKLDSDEKPSMLFRALFGEVESSPTLTVSIPDGAGGMAELAPESVDATQLAGWAFTGPKNDQPPLIGNILLTHVFPKQKEVNQLLRSPDKDADDNIFKSMHPFGFRKSGFGETNYTFESVRGAIRIGSRDGINTTMYIGSIAGEAEDNSARLTRFMMLSADLNPDAFPMPEKPENPPEDPADPINKSYLQDVASRDKQVAFAMQTVRDLNRSFAGWYYVINEEIADILIPDVEFSEPEAPAEDPESATPNNGSASPENEDAPTENEDATADNEESATGGGEPATVRGEDG